MSNKEEFYRNKLLNNELIEKNSFWNEGDNYYCACHDSSLSDSFRSNLSSAEGIKRVVLEFHKVLINRYHNKFYLHFKETFDGARFIFRGQPFFDNTFLSVVVKYVLDFSAGNFQLNVDFITIDDANFYFESRSIVNFRKENDLGLFGKLKKFTHNKDNSNDIGNFISSINLDFLFKSSSQNSLSNKNKPVGNVSKEVPRKTRKIDGNSNVIRDSTGSWSSGASKKFLIYCVECGCANYPLRETCSNCNSPLIAYSYRIIGEFSSFEELVNKDNISLIENAVIPEDFYQYVLDCIAEKSENNHFTGDMNIFDKILYICRHYVNVIPNDELEDFGGYEFNSILLNPTYSRSQQCSTLIKYLAVDIYVEILESLFMYIFDVKNNIYVRSFINFVRMSSIFEVFIQTYMSTRVESHFIPEKYHNYEEVEKFYFSNTFDEETLKMAFLIGTTYAKDIIGVLEEIIDDDIINDLEKQFEIDDEDTTEAIRRFDYNEIISTDLILEFMKKSMATAIEILLENKEAYSNLIEMKKIFESLENGGV